MISGHELRIGYSAECQACGGTYDDLELKTVAGEMYCRTCVPDPAPYVTVPDACRGRLSHSDRPAAARVWFNDDQPGSGPLLVCATCSREMLRWMKSGRVNAVGQYPTAHYPIEGVKR